MIPIGTRILERYVVARELGAGSQGRTYEIESRAGRIAVLKVPDVVALGVAGAWERGRPRDRDRELERLREGFRWEETARWVSSPYVVRVHEYHEQVWVDSARSPPLPVPGVILERVEGRPLSNPPRPLSLPEVLHVVATLCEGLAACHAAGLVHRDLAPKNVMVKDAGGVPHAVIIDFGTARPDSHGTVWAGTPKFAPPEPGRRHEASGRLQFDTSYDIWPVGIILAKELQTRHPFGNLPVLRGPERELALAGAEPDLDGVRTVNPRVAALVTRCLDVDPAKRPTALALARELRRELNRVFSTLDDRDAALGLARERARARESMVVVRGADLAEKERRLEVLHDALHEREAALRRDEQAAARTREGLAAREARLGQLAPIEGCPDEHLVDLARLTEELGALRRAVSLPRQLAAGAILAVALLASTIGGFWLAKESRAPLPTVDQRRVSTADRGREWPASASLDSGVEVPARELAVEDSVERATPEANVAMPIGAAGPVGTSAPVPPFERSGGVTAAGPDQRLTGNIVLAVRTDLTGATLAFEGPCGSQDWDDSGLDRVAHRLEYSHGCIGRVSHRNFGERVWHLDSSLGRPFVHSEGEVAAAKHDRAHDVWIVTLSPGRAR